MGTDFRSQLAKQLRFIETSCRAFDGGDVEEAMRLAVSLRLLFHDRGRSVSLLTHLGVRDRLMLYTDVNDIGDECFLADMLTTWIGNRAIARLRLEPKEKRRFVHASLWWEQIIFVQGQVRISRGDLVRYAADKDGGAHVDAEQDPNYVTLQSMWSLSQDGGNRSEIDVTRLGLRTMAFQLLNSPEIHALARLPSKLQNS